MVSGYLFLVISQILEDCRVRDVTMALRTAGSVLVVFLWSVTVVLGQDGWSVTYTTQSICTLRGSTVDLFCSYTYPSGHKVTTTFWFTKKYDVENYVSLLDDPDYKGRVTYRSNKKNGHTLKITDLRESDSATYKFRFITKRTEGRYSGYPGVTLSVTDLQVKVTTTWWSTTLTCSTPCTLTGNPTYTWYRNSKIVQEDSSPSYTVQFKTEDSFYCAVKGINSPAVSVEGHSYFHVTYTQQRICTLKGTSVDISCSYTYPSGHTVSETNWYTNGKLEEASQILSPGYGRRVEYLGNMQSDSILRITDLREEDSAEYKFRFRTDQTTWEPTFPGTTLTVTGLQVKVTPATVTEGQKVTVTCSTTCTLSDNPNATYIWYKNGHVTNQSISLFLNPVSSEDAGRYSCSVEGHEDLPSDEETLTVRYGPKNTSVSVSPYGEIVEGSSVTLTCSSDANPPVDKYTWYKKNVTSPKASGQSYSITNIISEDRGEYYCEAQNGRGSMNSTALMIIVAGKQTSVLTAAVGIIVVVLVLILCLSGLMCFRSFTGGSDASTDTQSVRPDCNSDTYTGLNMRTMSPDYDTLANVHADPNSDPNSDMYTPLNMKTMSPEYDTLANVRGPSH
ncbi:B-cell receptor CD22-like isoform X1 [Oncorhynchus kisutch]|uniref:B-cell receptor CD22-like isoform X1 n=2 Tax=Oncorhynchus kisutch TaxID=8019 RepID=UPI0012DD8C42|nr:B-cell receptor CD22-like isoform X1 [Oncorhynchus kisutch]